MPRTQEQLGCSIPDGHYNLVTPPISSSPTAVTPYSTSSSSSTDAQSSQSKVSNLDDPSGCDEDVGGLQIAMQDVMRVQVSQTKE